MERKGREDEVEEVIRDFLAFWPFCYKKTNHYILWPPWFLTAQQRQVDQRHTEMPEGIQCELS